MSKARNIAKVPIHNTNLYEGREGLVYVRVSNKQQETDGSGQQSQDGRCQTDLLSVSVPYVRTFPDIFSGGGDFMRRPAMREMLEYIDLNPHRKFVVVFDDLSRFARDVFFHIKLRAEFKKRDVILRCLNYNFDDSEEGEFAELIFAGKAELDRKQNRRQVIQKQKARLDAGYWAFGTKKGYTMVKDPLHGKLEVPNEEGKIFQEALEGFANGIFIRKVDACRFLVEKGFWKKQLPEKYIDKFTNYARDPFYCGDIQYLAWNVERRKGKHVGIISLDTYNQVQKRLGREALNKRIRLDVNPDFPLRGLIVCGQCSEHLTSAWSQGRGKRYPYYLCHNKKCSVYGKSMDKNTVEAEFDKVLKSSNLKPKVEIILMKIFDENWSVALKSIKEDEITKIELKTKLLHKIKDLTDVMLATKSDQLKRVYESQILELANELEALDTKSLTEQIDFTIPYRTALEKSVQLLKSPYNIWHSLEVREQQKLFHFIFEEKLPYSKKTGYRTDKLPYATRLFEDFVAPNTSDVEMGVIETPSELGIHTDSTVHSFSLAEPLRLANFFDIRVFIQST